MTSASSLREHTVREITAPLSGILVPLETVPDPVFANKMVGDGVSLDPTSDNLLAPVDGVVTQLHKAHHAVTIHTDDGLDVLLHIGIDTVMLRGEGFAPLVQEGDRVHAGQPLIVFDLDQVGRSARSLLTQIVITEGERVLEMAPASGLVEAGKTPILRLRLAGSDAAPANQGGAGQGPAAAGAEPLLSPEVALPNPSGLHARPAAVFAAKAKSFASDIALLRDDTAVNGKSVVAIMGLATRFGDRLRVRASGPDAEAAVQALAMLLAEGCGEAPGQAPAAPVSSPAAAAPQAARPRVAAGDGRTFTGVSASPGLALGRIFQVRQDGLTVEQTGGPAAEELAAFEAALAIAAEQLDGLKIHMATPHKARILDAHKELLQDPDLLDEVRRRIGEGNSAAYAWQQAFAGCAARLEMLDNPLLRERAADVRDVGRRVLVQLVGARSNEVVLPEDAVLVAEELSPSELAGLDRSRVRGICTVGGGATSHLAIIARSFGLPAVVGADDRVLDLADGTPVLLDGSRGTLKRDLDEAELAEAKRRLAEQVERHRLEQQAAHAPAVTRDGHRVEVVANVSGGEDARAAVAGGAEGVGLLRSEFLFDERPDAPSEEEQAAAYREVAEALGRERPLVIRTLDAGGDKPLAYMPLPREDNPFLGMRGIRVSLDRQDLLRVQLRAILRAAPLANLHIMFPMVAGIDELRRARAILEEEQAALGVTAKVGIMVEVPSAAVLSEVLAREVDFFSIGTNDLTQYTLAMDRGHPQLAKQADGLHPAVLRMIAMTVEGAHAHGKWVGVCGGIASDVMAVPVLIGLGVDELSVGVPAIGAVKAIIGRVTRAECQELAREVLGMATAAEVRARLAPYGG
ncbi:phosphoenolpyruvate--protein phosphotransferase [Azospirillum thermophilum]|uniref:phosphoenolpyruvate--protein phosphotransferase n=1 Tax=Azospirillum thermophilum TaxID=2202148 RepID=A0A2S2CVE9_9PROT|nr:phosphoenolpyruvate--protein phosphotransferase [Azospirillum thermophilum]AWK88458.1 phosphoenolpyruvate--protein phosphotransferase [Azospirillum thermophilum]